MSRKSFLRCFIALQRYIKIRNLQTKLRIFLSFYA